jgi:hypothetical protein
VTVSPEEAQARVEAAERERAAAIAERDHLVRAMSEQGESVRQIAARFGLHPSRIGQIIGARSPSGGPEDRRVRRPPPLPPPPPPRKNTARNPLGESRGQRSKRTRRAR